MSEMVADFTLQDHGSIVLLIPQTDDATAWCDDHHVGPLIDGILADGLEISLGG